MFRRRRYRMRFTGRWGYKEIMRVFLTILSILFFISKANSQTDDEKIDSVFKHYFFVFEISLSNCCPPEKYPDYYYYVVLTTNDTVYLNKYSSEAAEFMQKISKIKYPIFDYESGKPVVFAVNPETVGKWKDWYAANRHKIKWNNKKNEPVLK